MVTWFRAEVRVHQPLDCWKERLSVVPCPVHRAEGDAALKGNTRKVVETASNPAWKTPAEPGPVRI